MNNIFRFRQKTRVLWSEESGGRRKKLVEEIKKLMVKEGGKEKENGDERDTETETSLMTKG